LQTGDEQYKHFRSCVSARMLVFFILALATLQSLVVLILETPQNVYGQTQATVTGINIVGDLSLASPSLVSNLKPTSNLMMISASIPDNGNNNTTPFLLPSPSSGQSSGNNSPPPADAGLASTPLASNNNNILNSNSPPQGDNSNNNSTNTHHHSHSISQSNTVGINDNHGSDQHKNHKHGSTVDIINQIVSQSKQQFSGGQIPFP
jgi:hypothetical protein